MGPHCRNQVDADRVRIAEMRALADGREPPAAPSLVSALSGAAMHDPEVSRGFVEAVACLALPQEVVARPGMRERIERWSTTDHPPPPPGPDRAQLLQLLDA